VPFQSLVTDYRPPAKVTWSIFHSVKTVQFPAEVAAFLRVSVGFSYRHCGTMGKWFMWNMSGE